ncbi:hypothetical protein [Methylobacterium sp. Leaf118]|uniref:hypothetical protein n=1 Tax=Methylobacterium sp. Leaf118 TaxID=2876562 RepID=UPI001E312B91|nr:hypothetical protein [Methylobacterium sp. Leaf118]
MALALRRDPGMWAAASYAWVAGWLDEEPSERIDGGPMPSPNPRHPRIGAIGLSELHGILAVADIDDALDF